MYAFFLVYLLFFAEKRIPLASKCYLCSTKKVMHTDEERLLQRVRQRFNKACADYHLIADGDRILVAVSGGKDSLALLQLLGERSRILKPHFEVRAAHVIMSNIGYRSDVEYLKRFSEGVGVELDVLETSFDPTTDKRKSPCFLCSWNRRKALFEHAKSLHFNKIALGHHMDDILVTLLMNMSFQGAFGTMPPLLKMDKFEMTLIRPLCRIAESDLREMSRIENYQLQQRVCPYEQSSFRADIQDILARLESLSPDARYNLWASMTNIQESLLPPKEEEKQDTSTNAHKAL